MRGYMWAEGGDEGRIPVRSRIGIYRDPDRGEAVVAAVDGDVVPLGVADVTVSRCRDEECPVAVVPRESSIEIHNNGNSNGVTVTSGGDRTDLSAGRVESIRSDARVEIGYRTELRIETEAEPKIEKNVVHQGEGNVVMGNLTDKSTSIGDDNVINRSDIGGEAVEAPGGSEGSGKETGETEPLTQYCPDCGAEIRPVDAYCTGCGRDLGDGDTRRFCQRHERTYRGDVCPECAEH